MFINFRVRGKEKKGEIETSMGKKNIDWLPTICSLTGDQTCNLGMCPDQQLNHNLLVQGVMLQPIEPPSQG